MKQSQAKYSVWKDLITFINSLPIGYVVSRKQLFNIYKDYPMLQKPQPETVDVYRRQLTVLGYLTTTDSSIFKKVMRGKYKIVKHIPEDLPSNTAYKQPK